jgi:hypothetical protein
MQASSILSQAVVVVGLDTSQLSPFQDTPPTTTADLLHAIGFWHGEIWPTYYYRQLNFELERLWHLVWVNLMSCKFSLFLIPLYIFQIYSVFYKELFFSGFHHFCSSVHVLKMKGELYCCWLLPNQKTVGCIFSSACGSIKASKTYTYNIRKCQNFHSCFSSGEYYKYPLHILQPLASFPLEQSKAKQSKCWTQHPLPITSCMYTHTAITPDSGLQTSRACLAAALIWASIRK